VFVTFEHDAILAHLCGGAAASWRMQPAVQRIVHAPCGLAAASCFGCVSFDISEWNDSSLEKQK
jgi:hypothetical protein